MSAPPDEFELSRTEKLRRIEELGLDPWGGRFDNHQPIATIRALPTDRPDDQRPRVRAAGRIKLRRTMGKVHFLTLWDWTGEVQVMLGQKQIGETGWKLAQELDLGDLLGVDGGFGKTKTGEPTIFATALHFLGKSLQPHPDKHSGMQEMEFRLRHRYLDLIYTPETLDRARKRIKMIQTIRRHLDDQGFCEVETPTLHAIAGGAAARPFVTHHNALDIDLFLRIALELPLKRLLVGGIEKVYEIGRVFRNEGIDARHNPEFTMLELYQAYGDYHTHDGPDRDADRGLRRCPGRRPAAALRRGDGRFHAALAAQDLRRAVRGARRRRRCPTPRPCRAQGRGDRLPAPAEQAPRRGRSSTCSTSSSRTSWSARSSSTTTRRRSVR